MASRPTGSYLRSARVVRWAFNSRKRKEVAPIQLLPGDHAREVGEQEVKRHNYLSLLNFRFARNSSNLCRAERQWPCSHIDSWFEGDCPTAISLPKPCSAFRGVIRPTDRIRSPCVPACVSSAVQSHHLPSATSRCE